MYIAQWKGTDDVDRWTGRNGRTCLSVCETCQDIDQLLRHCATAHLEGITLLAMTATVHTVVYIFSEDFQNISGNYQDFFRKNSRKIMENPVSLLIFWDFFQTRTVGWGGMHMEFHTGILCRDASFFQSSGASMI